MLTRGFLTFLSESSYPGYHLTGRGRPEDPNKAPDILQSWRQLCDGAGRDSGTHPGFQTCGRRDRGVSRFGSPICQLLVG